MKKTKNIIKEEVTPTARKLAKLLDLAIEKIDPDLSYTELALAVAEVLRNQYGTQNYRPFVVELMRELKNDLTESTTYAGKSAIEKLKKDPAYRDLSTDGKKDAEQKLEKGNTLTLETDNTDFFEDTAMDDRFVDVSGPSVENAITDMLEEFEERLKDIPEEDRNRALSAIKNYWTRYIKDWTPNLETPHRPTITEGQHFHDTEGNMAKSQLISLIKNAKNLYDSLDDHTQLQSWVQSKLTKAEDYINSVRVYLDGESVSRTAPLTVGNNPVSDAEGGVLHIGDVVKAADGGIYQIAYSYTEGKPFLTPFDLKKRKLVNLRTRHYFDQVNETEMSPVKQMHKVLEHSATKGGFVR
jgi:hypothetical protein